jgi:signal transduction histidine kinase
MMPGLSGFEVCRIIKQQERYKDIPVIFLTAKNEVDDIVEGFEAGAVDYIIKPFYAKEVFVRVSTHLQLKHTREMLQDKNNKLEELNQSLVESKLIIEKDALQLKKLNDEKNKFFSIIAHDLRGPFGGLIGITDILYSQLDDIPDPQIKELIELLQQSSNQVFSLLNNLLEWSRLQMDAVVFDPIEHFLSLSINETVQLFTARAQEKNISINIIIDDSLVVNADINMLKTIVRNLISNAIKFNPKNGIITIDASETEDGMITVSITDSGIGMNEDLQKKLFSLDQKVSRPGTEGETSNGLGLILCKDLVEKQGGKIWVESQEQKGATFRFTLPGKKTG